MYFDKPLIPSNQENRLYMSYPELPILGNKLPGKGLFWVKDPNRVDHVENLDYYHVWLEKYYYKTDTNFRDIKVKELNAELELLKKRD